MKTDNQPITQLFNPDFVKQYLAKNAPEFVKNNDLSDLTITPIKRDIGITSYHVVIRFDSASCKDMPIFCSAHSKENRENPYHALAYIEKNSPTDPSFLIPKPLFFDKEMSAFFYQGHEGKNFLYFLKNESFDISEYIKKTAKWISTLHSIPTGKAENYNKENSKIKTTIPGPEKFIPKIQRIFPEFLDQIRTAFEKISSEEEELFLKLDKKCLIHGDLHPENVIITKTGDVSIIDFTDACLSDWTRDVGNFIQQLGYMSRGARDEKETEKNQKLFYDEYLKERSISSSQEIEKRIELYKSWSALRSTIYFLTKADPEPENARQTLKELNI